MTGIETVCPTCGSPVIADADTGRYLGLALLERAERAEIRILRVEEQP